MRKAWNKVMLQTFGRETKPGRWTIRRKECPNIVIIPEGKGQGEYALD